MKVVGIDPGMFGAVCSWDGQELVTSPFPVIKGATRTKTGKKKVKKDKDVLDWDEIAAVFQFFYADADRVYIEKVGAMPGQGVTSMFNFGYNAGFLSCLPRVFGVPITFVTPQKWKQKWGLSSDKERSFAKARELFPEYIDEFKSKRLVRNAKQCEGVAEASLIARYGYEELIGG